MKRILNKSGIPIAPALNFPAEGPANPQKETLLKKRLVQISLLSIVVAAAISVIAKILVALINLVTNISFYGLFDIAFRSPANNHLGFWVIFIPAIGGILVGIMALYGSKAIRGHGIPEAMEQVLTNQSKIKPSIAILKPISSAFAIGTGGPFGAEGPIIATGGALGSTLGQLFKITSSERKIILAAGATAGMAAIFGTPIAAIFLAIELLLFEFSPRSILPVALACITGAAGHQLFFESGPVFPMPELAAPSNTALGIYSAIGIVVGFLSLLLTKIVYMIEDAFEELPIHWMWWPALGGLAVGIIGYFAPHTLGVGYDNIISLLSGNVPLTLMTMLAIFKFLSWAIALGSGTSGGTLAPLMTMGGAAGGIIGSLILSSFPGSGISIPMAALIGMSAMFAGASRAYLTSILFALEATHQSHGLLPLLGACTGSYLVSFFFMENTIMTEKIARRGVFTPDSYEPDVLRGMTVAQVVEPESVLISVNNTIGEIRAFFDEEPPMDTHYLVVDQSGAYSGAITLAKLFNSKLDSSASISTIIEENQSTIKGDDHLAKAVELFSETNTEFLPVRSATDENTVIGILTYKNILHAYKMRQKENQEAGVTLSWNRGKKKILIRGRKFIAKKPN